jgi:hypothetical protein
MPQQAELRIPQMREVPREWEQQLAEISPPTNRFTYLKLIWEQGYPWEVCERYFVYQMMPARMMTSPFHAGILEQLERALPPQGYYDHTLGQYVEEANCLITTRAWKLYRETGCWGKPYWVIQGDKGGHKRWFTQVEKKFLRLVGLPDEPPEPGELPYAPFDDRVLAKLREHDVLQGDQSNLRRSQSLTHGFQSARTELLERELRQKLTAWLKDQAREIGPEYDDGLAAIDAPRQLIGREEQIAEERAAEIAEENYIETGQTNGGKPLTLLH